MSHYPPHGPHPPYGPPPPYYGHPHWPPPPPHHLGPMPPPPDGGQVTAPQPYPYFVPGVMVPVAMPPPPPQPDVSNPTYITNYIYHGEGNGSTSTPTPAIEPPKVVELAGEYDWVPSTSTTAGYLNGQAVVGGHEGWDGSPLWVIRASHNGDMIPGKFSIRHTHASIMYEGKEVPVQNIEVLIAKPDRLRWIPASNGSVPPGALIGGNTVSGEPLYIGRARHQLSLTPGKVHPSHGCCYIGFGGAEISHKMYDVLCRY